MALRWSCLWLYICDPTFFCYRQEEIMEERKFSPEQSEEVIELLDIVDSSVSENGTGHEEPLALEDMVTEESGAASSSEAGVGASDTDDLLLLDDDAVVCRAENDQQSSHDAVTSEGNGSTAVPEAEEPRTAAVSEDTMPAPENGADHPSEASCREDIRVLEERVAALEKANRELAENVESLSQQLAQVGTMFLEDASVRLHMEELVSRMLDARLPVPSEQEEADASDAGSSLKDRVDALERRMDDEEARSEQRAAAAAARVIRDEIAAMKAEALHTSC